MVVETRDADHAAEMVQILKGTHGPCPAYTNCKQTADIFFAKNVNRNIEKIINF